MAKPTHFHSGSGYIHFTGPSKTVIEIQGGTIEIIDDPTTLDGSITDSLPEPPGYSRAKLDRLMPPCVDGELPEGWRP